MESILGSLVYLYVRVLFRKRICRALFFLLWGRRIFRLFCTYGLSRRFLLRLAHPYILCIVLDAAYFIIWRFTLTLFRSCIYGEFVHLKYKKIESLPLSILLKGQDNGLFKKKFPWKWRKPAQKSEDDQIDSWKLGIWAITLWCFFLQKKKFCYFDLYNW